MSNDLLKLITDYTDFPKEGILFKDILPLLEKPKTFKAVITRMSTSKMFQEADAIIAIDARGFIFGGAIALKLSKPMIVARKFGKLPGELLYKSYDLEYGTNTLSIQKSAIASYQSFVIVDDLLATGGTVNCVSNILRESEKDVKGLSVVIELSKFNAKASIPFPIESQIIV